MGINLKDFADFAVGAIEQDKKNTNEKFAIRAEELQANRASLIKRKDARYAKDIAAYDAEKKKYDILKSAASDFKNGAIDERTYAALYHTTKLGPAFKDLDKTTKENMIEGFDGKTVDYTLEGNADEIERKYAVQESNINKVTAKALEDARGNSFLVKKIIGESNSAKKDLATQVETALKASDTVLTSKSISGEDSSLVGLPVKVGKKGTMKWSRFKKKNPDWIKQYNLLDKEIKYGSATQNNNFLNFMRTSQILGTNTEAQFKLTNDDTKIEGLNPAAQSILDSYKGFYDTVKSNFSAQELAAQGVDITEIRDFMTTEAINKQVQNLMSNRSKVKEIGKGLKEGKKMDFVFVVPLNVMDINNKVKVQGQGISLPGGKGIVEIAPSKMTETYKLFVEQEAPALANKFKQNKTFNSLNAVQTSIKNGGEYYDKFMDFVSDELGLSVPPDNPSTSENESILNAPKVKADDKLLEESIKPSKPSSIKIDPKNNGFIQNGKYFTWEEVEKNDEVKNLPPLLKLRYDNWKSKQ